MTGLSNIRSIAASYYNGYAIANNGAAYAWGRGDMGAIGDGNSVYRYVPVQVSGVLNPVKIISGDAGWAMALLQDGSLRAWGYNINSVLWTGATDGTFLWALKGIPIVTMGAGDRQVPHQLDEWVDLQQLVDTARIYALTALHYLWFPTIRPSCSPGTAWLSPGRRSNRSTTSPPRWRTSRAPSSGCWLRGHSNIQVTAVDGVGDRGLEFHFKGCIARGYAMDDAQGVGGRDPLNIEVVGADGRDFARVGAAAVAHQAQHGLALALDPAGIPYISYLDKDNEDLKLAKESDGKHAEADETNHSQQDVGSVQPEEVLVVNELVHWDYLQFDWKGKFSTFL